jgi:Zn-dependent peptidase ImmA (M78 family)
LSSPEVNLARRLVARLALKVPIDIFEIARQFAKVEKLRFPIDADGVCFDLKQSGKTPSIFINVVNRSSERIRFTLAHELGHVLIPWHTGSIVDEIDIVHEDSSSEYWRLEGEANRFASELLMPTSWVKEVIEEFPLPLAAVAHIARNAEVSFQAATIKVLGCLEAGSIYAQVQEGIVISSGRSRGTLANQPSIGDRIKPLSSFAWTRHRWSRVVGNSEYHWWQFKGDSAPPTSGTNEDWRELLNAIVADIGVNGSNVSKFKLKVNGIIAYANGRTRTNRTRSRIYEACLERLHSNASNDEDIRRMLIHKKFERFLVSRIESLLM